MCRLGRSSRWVSVALLSALTVPAAFAQHREGKRLERADILTMESEWRQAQLSENIPEMEHLLSDDFLGITAAGEVVTKIQQLDRMRTRQMDLTRIEMADTKIKISGNLAVVTSLAELDGTSEGHPLSGYFRYTRVYQRKPGSGWKITNFEATRVPNGRVYGMNTIPPRGAAVPASTAPSSPPASPAAPGSPRPPS